MTPQEVLLQAADLIERAGWCQGTSAMNSTGQPVHVMNPDACRFCMFGALERVGGIDTPGFRGASRRALQMIPEVTMSLWNDRPGRTKDEVVAMLRKAALEGK